MGQNIIFLSKFVKTDTFWCSYSSKTVVEQSSAVKYEYSALLCPFQLLQLSFIRLCNKMQHETHTYAFEKQKKTISKINFNFFCKSILPIVNFKTRL